MSGNIRDYVKEYKMMKYMAQNQSVWRMKTKAGTLLHGGGLCQKVTRAGNAVRRFSTFHFKNLCTIMYYSLLTRLVDYYGTVHNSLFVYRTVPNYNSVEFDPLPHRTTRTTRSGNEAEGNRWTVGL